MDFELINVSMNQIKCVHGNHSLIGTKGIASCIGVLLYDRLNKKAIVGHFNSNKYDGLESEDASYIFMELKDAILNNNLSNELVYLLVPGIVGNTARIKNVALELEKYLENYEKMDCIEDSAIMMNVETESLEFVFDPNNNKFLTHKFFPNDVDYKLYSSKVK